MTTREQLLESRWIRPFAHRLAHPSLWHVNRRSLSKGVGLGLFAGLIIPFGQIVLATLLAIPLRANVPIAAATTFVTNPFTTPFIYLAAYWVGDGVLVRTGVLPADVGGGMVAKAAHIVGPTLFGVVLFAFVFGAAGFVLSRAWSSLRLTRRWRQRGR